MIKRQTITALICAVIAAILAIVYFVTVEPMLVPEKEKVTPIELIDPLERHTYDQQRVYMFPPLDSARISKIEVHNSKGGYTFSKTQKGQFKIKGFEEAPYSTDALVYLRTTTGAGIASERYIIDEKTDLSVYGLDEGNKERGYFEITDDRGNTHTVWVGKKAPSGDGYYCRYDGRNAVYLIRTAGFEVLFAGVYDILTPTLALPVQQSAYGAVTVITVLKDGVPLFKTKTLYDYNKDGQIESYSYGFDMTTLNSFTPDESMRNVFLDNVSGLAGSRVVAYGEAETTKELLKKNYRIDWENPFYCIYYEKFTDDFKGYEDVYIYFSSPDSEGKCYAYTTAYGEMVVEIPFATFSGLYNKTLTDYITKFLDMTIISKVTRIEINGAHPDLDGVFVDTAYGIKSTPIENSEKTVQTVWHIATNEYLTADRVENFRLIYGDYINIQLEGEIDVSSIEEKEHLATVKISYTDGSTKIYDFYAYSATRCYYTINGELTKHHTFSVTRDNVEKLIRDVYNFEQGYTLDPNL